ncbi:TadE/TadG family type IV pilus assembly protein [Nocardioides solisilvae]|uniref:TadE/TadG family type IV pilus assembly protein n=1 Tax=Nocardioides solisilvae TaxID=1542435 RepID=UPI000D745694|nr:TadE/TadG family type IV pilus assembly protein [Nocardioides solisilvae]
MSRRRDEQGSVAIFAAGTALLLLMVAAVATDLGNAWARGLTVQKSVDVATLSAGHLLPRTPANEPQIRQEVADYLNKAGNKVRGQEDVVSAAQLGNGDPSDGEVSFPDDVTMRVVAPPATVDYAFADVFGVDEQDVTKEATVQVRTPVPAVEGVMPMWVPASCVYGPLAGDVAAQPAPDASPQYTNPSRIQEHNQLRVTDVSPGAAPYATAGQQVAVTIDRIPSGRTWAVLRFTFGDTQYADYQVALPAGASTATVNVSLDAPTHRFPDNSTVSDPTNTWTITSTVGTWQVWVLVPDTSGTVAPSVSSHPLAPTTLLVNKPGRAGEFAVTGGGQVGCNEHQRGNFGQLDSPRQGIIQKQKVYAWNVAEGLDHELVPFDSPASFECAADGSPAGALIDSVPLDGRNCLYVDPGNDPQGLTGGLLGGSAGVPPGSGRLERPTDPECGRSDLNLGGGRTYNNDTLSCFLKDGYTLSDIAKDTGVPADALDSRIYESPRFFWVPVVWQGDRMLKKYLAIKTFAPVFLTDESTSSGPSATNGLTLNPGGKVQSMTMFGFNPDALPIPPNADTVEYQPGARKVLRLVD